MSFFIVQQDITKLAVDAIVNAANPALAEGSGVCGAIFRAAGRQQLTAACQKLAPLETGAAVITPGYNLAAPYIIHTVGPVYNRQSDQASEQLLRAAYQNSLQLAVEHELTSIAFPLISSGIYGYPPERAFALAVSVIKEFIQQHEIDVILTVLDKTVLPPSHQLARDVERYLESRQQPARTAPRRTVRGRFSRRTVPELKSAMVKEDDLASPPLPDLFAGLDESFSQLLLRLIDDSGQTDVAVYKRANLNRRLFSKIRSQKDYLPSKRTALALAVALQLDLTETGTLLGRAGYALSPAVKADLIVEYFISRGNYDIHAINEVLFTYDQPLLGAGLA